VALICDAWVSSEDVDRLRLRPQNLLIDARGTERFSGRGETIDPIAGHVPGARNLPFLDNLGVDGRFLPAAQLRQRFATLFGSLPAASVISMCGSGVTACHHLLALEHADLCGARLYAGSWSEWIRDPRRPIATGAF
jgi:thiosulfate/3-mercaptopyruvate sulfurtransferase